MERTRIITYSDQPIYTIYMYYMALLAVKTCWRAGVFNYGFLSILNLVHSYLQAVFLRKLWNQKLNICGKNCFVIDHNVYNFSKQWSTLMQFHI